MFEQPLNDLEALIAWKNTHGVNVLVGEFGWPNDSPYANPKDYTPDWNYVGDQYVARAMEEGIWLTQWNVGETQKLHKLSLYSGEADATSMAPLSRRRSSAPVFEANPSTPTAKYGFNLSGGEYGAFVQTAVTGPSSNERDIGVFTDSAAYDTTASLGGHLNQPYALNAGTANGHGFPKAWNYGSEGTWQFLGALDPKPGVIRLPFRMERLYPTLGGDLDAGNLARLDEALGWALAAGIPVILDCHNFGSYYTDNGAGSGDFGTRQSVGGATVTSAHFGDFWTKMAAYYKDNPAVIGYDLMNEPVQATNWVALADVGLQAVRSTGDTKMVVVAASGWGDLETMLGMTPWLTDPADNLWYGPHHYFDGAATYSQTFQQYAATP